ncbi:MAG TPA: DoxX family protein [Candidatus Binataceae bacterium]|nr:DoxX family protein [Candidatus Binataceae bacterium]
MDSLRGVGALLGRIMMAYIFVSAGIEKIGGPAATMNFMASGGLPRSLVPELFVLSVVVELVGGLMLAAGWHAELASLIMFLFMIPVTIIFHVSTGQTVEWEKNLAIMGGLLMVAVLGPGGMSLRRARK